MTEIFCGAFGEFEARCLHVSLSVLTLDGPALLDVALDGPARPSWLMFRCAMSTTTTLPEGINRNASLILHQDDWDYLFPPETPCRLYHHRMIALDVVVKLHTVPSIQLHTHTHTNSSMRHFCFQTHHHSILSHGPPILPHGQPIVLHWDRKL